MNKEIGSPERPLSDLGKVSYRSYWDYTVLSILKNGPKGLTIKNLCDKTSIAEDDIVDSLKRMNLATLWKGSYVLHSSDKSTIEQLWESYQKPTLLVKPEKLKWSPPIEF